jgi:NitT/TauT family transport system substrate-binding protein
MKAEVVEKAVTRVEFTWDPIAPSLKKSAEAAHRIGLLKGAPELSGIYSLSYLNDVLKKKNLPPVQAP